MTTIQTPRKHATQSARVRDLSGRVCAEAAKRGRIFTGCLLSEFTRRPQTARLALLLERVQNDLHPCEGRSADEFAAP